MIDVFDNETENGKLYISYPMVEALRDIPVVGQDCFSRCCISINAGKSYKEISSYSIHWKQQDYYVKTYQMIFVLSAFPLFLLEYFGEEFWKDIVDYKKEIEWRGAQNSKEADPDRI